MEDRCLNTLTCLHVPLEIVARLRQDLCWAGKAQVRQTSLGSAVGRNDLLMELGWGTRSCLVVSMLTDDSAALTSI